MKQRVLIFAFTRTGSSVLKLILGVHPLIKPLGEPFHPHPPDGRKKYVAGVVDAESLHLKVDEIHKDYNLIKHLAYQLPMGLNENLLTKEYDKVIYLWRRNATQRAVSQEISRQSKEWGRDRTKIIHHSYSPINLINLQDEIDTYLKEVQVYRQILKNSNVNHIEIVYEDLFGLNVSRAQKHQILDSIIRFLGIPKYTHSQIKKVDELLDPANSKVNSDDTYNLIPNIDDVDRRFSNPTNGFLVQNEKPRRVKKILVISPIPSHPQNAGNRARIFNMLSILKQQGNTIHFLLDYQERGSDHIKRGIDESAMNTTWDHYVCVQNSTDRSILKYAASSPVRAVDNLVRKAGRYTRKHMPSLYTHVRPMWRSIRSGRIFTGKISEESQIDEWYNHDVDVVCNRLLTYNQYDIALVEYVYTSRVLLQFDERTIKIIDTHDVFTDRSKRYEKYGVPSTFFSTTQEEESKGLNRADRIIAIQDNEKKYYQTITSREVFTVGHLQKPILHTSPGKPNLLFIGSANPANIHGISYFIKKIFPAVRKAIPAVQLTIVGKICDHIPITEGCNQIGEVEDLFSVYDDTAISISPLYVGTGQKIKVVESLAHGIPVVLTPHSMEGLDPALLPGVVLATSDIEFQNQIISLMHDTKEYHLKRNNVKKSYIGYYEQQLLTLSQAFELDASSNNTVR